MSAKREEIYKAINTLIEALKTDEGKRIIEESNVKFEVFKTMTEDGEEWQDIEGYNGDYQVSNFGKVRSIKSGKWKLLKPNNPQKGYSWVRLSSKGIAKCHCIHVLVARTFIPNPKNKPEVNHKDGNKYNCSVDNLEWSTHPENMKHAFKIGWRGLDSPCAKLNKEQICYIRKNYKSHDRNYGIRALARKFNVNKSTIHRVIHFDIYNDV